MDPQLDVFVLDMGLFYMAMTYGVYYNYDACARGSRNETENRREISGLGIGVQVDNFFLHIWQVMLSRTLGCVIRPP